MHRVLTLIDARCVAAIAADCNVYCYRLPSLTLISQIALDLPPRLVGGLMVQRVHCLLFRLLMLTSINENGRIVVLSDTHELQVLSVNARDKSESYLLLLRLI